MQYHTNIASGSHVENVDTRERKLCWYMFLGLVCAAIGLRWLMLSGFQAHDDRNYVAYAWTIVNEGRVPLEHPTQWLVRIGYVGALAASIATFGLNAWSLAAYPFFCSIGGFVLLWKLGGHWFSERVRVLAAALMVVFPLDVLYASHAYPDLPLSFWMLLTWCLFLRAENAKGKRAVWYGCVGIAAGVAYLHRLDAVYLAVPFCAFMLWNRRIRVDYGWILAGVLSVVALEAVVWQVVADDPLFRINTLLQRRNVQAATRPDFGVGSGESGLRKWAAAYVTSKSNSRTGNNLIEPFAMFTTNQEFGLFYFLVLPIAVWTLWKRKLGFGIAAWIILLALFLAYFPIAFPKPMVRSPRYYCCLTVPSVLLLASWLMARTPHVRRTAVALLLVTSFVCLGIDGSRSAMATARLVREYVQQRSDDRIWLEPRMYMKLFVLEGVPPDRRVGIQLLTASSKSHAFQNAKLVAPTAAITEKTEELSDGLVFVVGDDKQPTAQDGWERIGEIKVSRSDVVEGLFNMFEAVGVPAHFVSRLKSGDGESVTVWEHVDSEDR